MGLYDYRYHLADENECRKLFQEIRWPDGTKCPRCGHEFIWKLGKKDRYKSKCRRCKYKFTETSGTIFEKTRTPISKWICAIGLFKVGISANQLKDEIRVTYKVAWQMFSKIRKAIKDDRLTSQLSGHVEVDEAYFGGRRKGTRGRGAAGKTPVIGILQRDGAVRVLAIPNVSSKTLQNLVKRHVEVGSTIYTDSYVGYKGLANSGFSHKVVNHQKSFVSRKGNHTNSIEGFWRLSKNKLYARHHKISGKHLPSYLAEAEFKYNERSHPDFIKLVLTKLISQFP
jgi:transposase